MTVAMAVIASNCAFCEPSDVSYVLSFLFSFSLLTSGRPGRDRRNCTNQLNLGRGNCQKTG